MTDNKNHDALRAILDRVDAISEAVNKQLSEISELIEEHFPDDCAGTCEGCGKLLLYGDKGWLYDDGPICCAPCSPNWGQAEGGFENSDDAEARANFEERLAAHLAAGGTRDDPMPLMEI